MVTKCLSYFFTNPKFGLAVPIPIQLDIDEHLSTIAYIEAELAELGENISAFQSPQSE